MRSGPRHFLLIPKNGLANRMRAIESGAAFAAANGLDYAVEWWREAECNADFSELFEEPSSFALRNRQLTSPRIRRFYKAIVELSYKAQGYHWVEDRNVLWWDNQQGREMLPPWQGIIADTPSLPSRFRGLALHTHREFFEPSPGQHYLEPRKELVVAARELLTCDAGGEANVFWLGVHIRRGDHIRATRHSPTDAFVAAIQRHLAAKPDARIFLATDSPAEEEFMRCNFPDRITTSGKTDWRRSAPDAPRWAMLELVCLSQCKFIIGSYWSSFSVMGARLGGGELEIVQVEPYLDSVV